jgi:hypothetical protein
MKNNSTKIFLLFAVVAIWGYAGFLVYGYVVPSVETPSTAQVEPKQAKLEDSTPKELQLDYPDPFLRKPTPKKRTRIAAPKMIIKSAKPTAAIKWPRIEYMGYVKGSGTLIMLNYNNKTEIVTQGEMLDSFRVSSFTPETVTIYYKEQEKKYTK